MRRPSGASFSYSASLAQENERLRRELAKHRFMAEELRQLRLKMETERRRQMEFLARGCHEIQVPVNGIVGMTELALQTELTEEQREYLSLLKISSDTLLNVVKDLLDLSRIEAGCLPLEQTPFSLRECLGDKLKMLALAAQRKEIKLNYMIAPEVPDILQGDPARLCQVVVNLIGNAIKFTEQGGVLLQVRHIGGSEKQVRLHFAVSDTGIGLREENLGRIFAPFVQAESSTTRIYGGSGLGLAIVARLVERMGSIINVESEPGQGSVFQFCLDFSLPEPGSQPVRTENFGGQLALVAESHPVSRRCLVNILRQWNFTVDEAANGSEAMRAVVQRRREGRSYHVALLADDLPKLNTRKVLARMQGRPDLGTETVILLGSLLHRSDDFRGEWSNSGGRPCRLSTPVKESELRQAILGRRSGSRLASSLPGTFPNIVSDHPLDILVVEDDPIGRRLAQHVLSRVGHRVTTAESGGAALAAIAHGHFDLALMDLQMPGMNGIETTRAIRQREKATGKHLLVIALTARAMAEDGRRCLMAGMDACLIKPIQPVDLIRAIERLGRQHQLDRSFSLVRPTPSSLDVRNDGGHDSSHQVIDRVALLERIGGDRRLLPEVLDLFRRRSPELLACGRTALVEGDSRQFSYAVHTLAGMFRSLSAITAQRIAETLEAQAGQDVVAAAPSLLEAYDQLEREAHRLQAALQEMLDEPAEQAEPMNPHSGREGMTARASAEEGSP